MLPLFLAIYKPPEIPSVVKVKLGVLHLVQQSRSYWDRSSEMSLVGSPTQTEVTMCD